MKTDQEINEAIAEKCGWKFGGPYSKYSWTTEMRSELNPEKFLTAHGFICDVCKQYHIGETINDAYCDCGINPNWVTNEIKYWKWEKWKHLGPVPNYCSDLNAMNEAETSAEFDHYPLREKYCAILDKICETDIPEHPLWMATARQRAIAFCRTVGIQID